MTNTPFELDPQLESSSLLIKDLPICQLRLKSDRRFPWVMLIPRQSELVEVFDLNPKDQQLLWSEISMTAEHMREKFNAHKMNIEILGNRVRQLHIHIIARKENDAAWPNSVLNHGTAEPYSPQEIRELIPELIF